VMRVRRQARLEHVLDRGVHTGGDLRDGGPAAQFAFKLSSQPLDGECALLQFARHADRPALVAEVPLDLTEDDGDREGGERRSAVGVEAVDGVDQADRGDLLQVFGVGTRVSVAAGEVMGTWSRKCVGGTGGYQYGPGSGWDQADHVPLTNVTSIDRCRWMAVDLPLAPKTKRPAGEPCCEPVVYPDVDRAHARRMAEVAKALGDPVRLQLVDVLRKHAGKVCVCELVPLFDISQPTLSHHLKKLREAGIVDAERRGLWAYYYVLPDALQELTTWLN
jgi:ArsR family transcriptional regulator, arsenate/arsenite/antimonite-responsive transcriptional repressor